MDGDPVSVSFVNGGHLHNVDETGIQQSYVSL